MKKGQAATEYVILIGLILIALIPLIYYAANKYTEETRVAQAENAVQTLKAAINNVNSLGPGSRDVVRVTIPSGVNSLDVVGNEVVLDIQLRGSSSDFHANSEGDVAFASLPTEKGIYNIILENDESISKIKIYTSTFLEDSDGDGIINLDDNCILVANPLPQLDVDDDKYGNYCDCDFDDDGTCGMDDWMILNVDCLGKSVPASDGPLEDPTCAESDMDGDLTVGFPDGSLFNLGGSPGPSCVDAGTC